MSCYEFEGTHYLRKRHFAECAGEADCAGCLRCTERHCGECRKGTHLGFGEHTCALCIGKVRATLRSLVDLYAALPEEAEVRGATSEAANLHGPATDAEAWSYRKAARSLRLGIPMSSLEDDDSDHPVFVLGQWIHALGEDYADRPDRQLTLSEAVAWLDIRLGRIANDVGQDFGQFRREINHCRTHMEAVLHDGEQRDTGAPCMTCNIPLHRVWGSSEDSDGWRCPKCKQTSTETQYRFAVKHLHREEATELNAYDMELRTGVKASTIRRWASVTVVRGEEIPPRIHSCGRDGQGRKLYRVEDVTAQRGNEEVAS